MAKRNKQGINVHNRRYFDGEVTIKMVAEDLKCIKQYVEKGESTEVRLQVQKGQWGYSYTILQGDPSYDQDHRGAWGSGYLTRSTNCRQLAIELLDQADEDAACNPECVEVS